MRINELFVENVDEGLGQVAANVAGGLSQGVGAVAGGALGAWDRMKQGFAAGRGAVNGTAPASGTTNAPGAGSTTVGSGQQSGTTTTGTGTQQGASATPPRPQPAAQGNNFNQIQAALRTLTPNQKTSIIKQLGGQVGTAQPAARPQPAAPNTGIGAMANQLGSNGPTGTGGTVRSAGGVTTHTSSANNPNRVATPESATFHSKFLGKDI